LKSLKWILLVFLCFLPFKWIISTQLDNFRTISIFIKLTDKIFLVSCLTLVIYIRFKGKMTFAKSEKIIFIILTAIAVWDLITGLINKNPLIATGAGIFYHLDNFLIVFVFSTVKWEDDEISKNFKVLMNLAIVLSLVGIFQELFMFFASVFTSHPEKMIFWPSALDEWRFLFYRVPSLLGHPNILAIYLLLFTTISLGLNLSGGKLLILTGSIYFTFSRMAQVLFVNLIFFNIKKRKWLISLVIWPTIFILLTMGSTFKELFPQSKIPQSKIFLNARWTNHEIAQSYYRGYVREKSIGLWREHKIFGIGAGMYGDVVSFIFNKKVYSTWDPHYVEFASKERNLDQFYPIIMAESGLPALVLFIGLFISLVYIAIDLMRSLKESFAKKLARSLIPMPVLISIILLVNTINMTFLWFTYLALLGMVISYSKNNTVREVSWRRR
jgi:hypothetical protein